MTAVEPRLPLSLHDPALVRARLLALAAEVIEVPAGTVDPGLSLWLQGLDSVRALELSAAVEDAFGVSLEAAILIEHSSVAALVLYLCGDAALAVRANEGEAPADLFARMRTDAVLPDDVRPAVPRRVRTTDARVVLLTGATGFLGAWLLRTLLAETSVRVVCLVRAGNGDPLERVHENLRCYTKWDSSCASRIEAVTGDVGAPGLGLAPHEYESLAGRVDVIYHAAAAVDWVRPYASLRATNVAGTLELLRLACAGRPKPFHLVSSLAVCYSTRGPRDVSEAHDPLPHLEGLHLGYAQTKSVAESLVRQAGARGLPVAIYRPALVTGDARLGVTNLDDLVSRLLKGCVQLGAAPDLDWRLDAVPVDHAARAIVRLSCHDDDASPRIFHLSAERPRHWRECVLWMNLRGHPMRLLPYREWAARIGALPHDSDNVLAPLRPFLLGRAEEPDALWLPELFEESRRSRADSRDSAWALQGLGEKAPAIDGRMLARYFDHFDEVGFLPEPTRAAAQPRHAGSGAAAHGEARLPAPVVAMIRRSLGWPPADGGGGVRVEPIGGDHSIVSELTSWRGGRTTGLFRCTETTPEGRQRGVILKLRPEDRDVIEVGEAVARLCGDAVGDAFTAAREHVGFTRGHLRELAIYRQRDERFVRHVPRVHAMLRDDEAGLWAIAMEPIDDAVLMNADDDPSRWREQHITAAIHGLAALQSVWLGKADSLNGCDWLPPPRTSKAQHALEHLWLALAEHARPTFADCAGHTMPRLHEECVARSAGRRRLLSGMPDTLVHGDFNPRNIAVRPAGGSALRLCAYDWELACVDVPQRDLAELLCFVLDPRAERREVDHWLAVHRRSLEQQSGRALDAEQWHAGFVASLETFLVERLAMYTLVHRIRPQRFLERVVRTWHTLWDTLWGQTP